MDVWRSEAVRWVSVALGSPASPTEWFVQGGVAVLALLIVMSFASKAVGMPGIGLVWRLLALTVGLGAMVAGTIAVSLYVLPRLPAGHTANIVVLAAPVLGGLLLGVPLQMAVLRARYGQVLAAFAAAVVAAVLLSIGAKTLMGSVEAGKADTGRLMDRQHETRNLLKDLK